MCGGLGPLRRERAGVPSGTLKAQRVVASDGCKAKRSQKLNCDEGGIRNGLPCPGWAVFNAVEGMTAWSLESLMEIEKKQFSEHLRETFQGGEA